MFLASCILAALTLFSEPSSAERDETAQGNRIGSSQTSGGTGLSIPQTYFRDRSQFRAFQRFIKKLLRKNPSLQVSKKALEHGLAYWFKNKDGGLNQCGGDKDAPDSLDNQKWMAVTDYTLYSNQKRMYFINMKSGQVISDYAAHGKGSSSQVLNSRPTNIGDGKGSNKTSGGFFVTQEIYTSNDKYGNPKRKWGGEEGNGLKLRGLNRYNKRAWFPRGIVIHGANYVTPGDVRRSEGCPAVQLGTFEAIKLKLHRGALTYLHTIEQDKLSQPEC